MKYYYKGSDVSVPCAIKLGEQLLEPDSDLLEERGGNELGGLGGGVEEAISITDVFELHPQHLQKAQL